MMLTTPRLTLREWRDDDLEPLAAMTSDPEVMRYFVDIRDRPRSDAWATRVRAHFECHGFGIWAVEAPGVAPFIGFVGLSTIPPGFPTGPGVEIVWTLARPFWRRGYALEAARATLDDGFNRLGLAEILSFTAVVNAPSRALMERLGMQRDRGGDFENPHVPAGHPLRPHALYRIRVETKIIRHEGANQR
jgi:RimJ/RimL family protein N-acetyltransferase